MSDKKSDKRNDSKIVQLPADIRREILLIAQELTYERESLPHRWNYEYGAVPYPVKNKLIEILKDVVDADIEHITIGKYSAGDYRLFSDDIHPEHILLFPLNSAWDTAWGGYVIILNDKGEQIIYKEGIIKTQYAIKYVNHLAGDKEQLYLILEM